MKLFSLLYRYGILALFIILGLYITPASLFSNVFGRPTITFVIALLSIFYDVTSISTTSFALSGYVIELIPACIAGSAYFLLTLLNLTTPMPLRKRIYSLVYLCAGFLGLNVIRIALFSYLFIKGVPLFDFMHIATWYIGSTILVAGLWFSHLKFLSIRAVPVYTDIKSLT